MHRDLAAPLGDLWTAVTRAGGAVGFLPAEPEADIRAAAERAAQDVRAGRQHLVAIQGPARRALVPARRAVAWYGKLY